MIEIIQEENWDATQERRGLPKSIKQMGTPDAGDRIYIENEAYQKLHPYGQFPERMVYVLLGHFDNYAGYDCTFIDDVVGMPEIEFQGKLPIWTDESWGCLYRKLRPEHENLVIVGWAVDICGQLPSMTAQLEHIHQSYFGGTHQVLLLLDSLEREEAFYSNRNGYLKRRTGFYICYNKVALQRDESPKAFYEENAYKENLYTEQDAYNASQQEFRRQESYREYLNNRRMRGINRGMNRGSNRRMAPQPQNQNSYASTILLLLVIVALGYSAIQNQKKAAEMEQALAQITQSQSSGQLDVWGTEALQSDSEDETVIRVEEIIGSITPDTSQAETLAQNEAQVQSGTTESTQVPSTQMPSTQTESTQVPETQVESTQASTVLSEAEIYLQQGYYIVQQGDSLAGICQKIYHTQAMMDELCQLNGIENPDAIYAGQYLDLP